MLPQPSPEQLGVLRGFERTAFAIADRVNRSPTLKRWSHAFLRTAGAGWVYHCTKHILHTYGLENLSQLTPDRGVIFVSNHRSFFDMYVLSCIALRHSSWIQGMYFPVRSNYFYDRPDGVAVSAVMSGFSMYPPIMRRPEQRALNTYAVDAITHVLKRPGSLVGFHPEGTRNKTDDPYTLLQANMGVGQIVYAAKPIVVPAFILGLSNNLPAQVVGNFDGTGDPITAVFGKPIELDHFYAEPAKLRTYVKIANHLRDEIQKLGHKEREIRAREGFPSLAAPSRINPADATDSSSRSNAA